MVVCVGCAQGSIERGAHGMRDMRSEHRGALRLPTSEKRATKKGQPIGWPLIFMERTTGLEPATPTLARLCSTN